jgi:methyl acetate hydrolase
MTDALQSSIDAILRKVTSGSPSVPGVVAIATDRNGNIYEGAAGKRMLGGDADMTTDSVFAIFSTTKAIAGTAALQLVEDGRLDLDAPAKIYAPDIGRCQVLEGFDDRGQPELRPPKRNVTTRMLLLHTAGFGYDFFNENYNRLAREHGQPSVLTATKASITRRSCSIPASSGNTARTSTGSVRSSKASPAGGSARSWRSGSSRRSA